MQTARPVVLSIGGFDPSAGAGVLADIKTMELLGVYGIAALTANTLQTADKLYHVDWIAAEKMVATLRVLLAAYEVQAVKIGITPDIQTLQVIIQHIREKRPACPIVWDPVLKSSSGFVFLNAHEAHGLNPILQDIQLVTPNLPEYQALKNNGMAVAGSGACAILLKGGHRLDKPGHDVLYQQGRALELPPTFDGVHEKHGSGCVLSSAIAAYLARGETLAEACRKGKHYVERFLKSNTALLGYHHETK